MGHTGLLWLFISYGYLLFKASNLISEGSELLLLVPSLAGLVGGVVLPLLGAVPDGAIMLFSGLGDKEKVQETLSVGVGALAGSTIMLLTIPFGMCVLAGRVDIGPSNKDGRLITKYNAKPKLTPGRSLGLSGVAITDEIRHSAFIMILTTIPYYLIQVPAFFIHGSHDEIASGESMYALFAFIICLIGFILYLRIHVQASKADEEKFHRMEKIKDLLASGAMSLSGALSDVVDTFDHRSQSRDMEYQAIQSDEASPKTIEYLTGVLKLPFQKYDKDKSEGLQKNEMATFLRDFKGMFILNNLTNITNILSYINNYSLHGLTSK